MPKELHTGLVSDVRINNRVLCSDEIDSLYDSTATGIRTINQAKNQMSVYPNPSNGEFTISFAQEIHNGALSIYNVLGERVHYQLLNKVLSIQRVKVEAVRGIYFVRIESAEGIYESKILLQ